MTLAIADSSQDFHQVARTWVFDGSRWLAASCAWVQPPTGAMKKELDCVGFINASVTAHTHTRALVNWSAPNADLVEILFNGSVVYTEPSATGSQVINDLIPSGTYTVIVRSYVGTEEFESAPLTLRMLPLPAPTSLTHGNITNTSYDMSWASVSSASSYDVYNADNNVKIAGTGALGIHRSGLTASTTYRTYVKAVHQIAGSSAASGVLSTTTSARFTPGTFEFYATSSDTWEGSGARWRGTGEGRTWHGDGTAFGASGGSRYSFFFGHQRNGQSIPTFFASQGAVSVNVTKVEFYAHRSSSQHGIYNAQTCRWHLHNHASKPSGAPGISAGPYDSGSLALGQSGWFTMPIEWGVALIAQPANHKGFSWGGWPYAKDGAGYMYGPTLAGNAAQGAIRITVG